MTRRELFAMIGSAAVLKGQTCNVGQPPANFPVPTVDTARALAGFSRPFDFTDSNSGYNYKQQAVNADGSNAYVRIVDGKAVGCTAGIVHHPGKDVNKGGGWDDFGESVRAVADGVVVYIRPTKNDINPKTNKPYGNGTNNPTTISYTVGDWMKMVYGSGIPQVVKDNASSFLEFTGANCWVGMILRHLYMGKIYYSLYGHVMQIDRTVAQLGKSVCKGTKIAEVAGLPNFAPHLHFEMRNTYYTSGELYRPSNEQGFCSNTSDAYVDARHFDPISFVDKHPSYNELVTQEIATINNTHTLNNTLQNPNPDTRFLSPVGTQVQLQSQNPFGYQGLEIRSISVTSGL